MSNLELNKGDNFIFCVDVSGSMSARDTPGGASRIDYLKEKIGAFNARLQQETMRRMKPRRPGSLPLPSCQSGLSPRWDRMT